MKKWNLNALVVAGCLIGFSGLAMGQSAVVITRKAVAKSLVPDASQVVPTDPYSHGEPSSDEQQMLEMVNRARANPYAECDLIVNSSDQHIAQGITVYNLSSIQLLQDFSAYSYRPPLAFNSSLLASAKAHSQDMAANDFQGHVSTDGATLADRMTRAGYSYSVGGENVFSYAHSLFYAQAAFLVDWGVPDLGHRKNMLDLNDHTWFQEIGISVIPETNSNTSVGPLVITQDFGTSTPQTVFILGVIYRDSNHNAFYDPGEGLANVTIMPNHGQYYAVTSASGGFAIPVAAGSGAYTLKTLRSDLPEMTASVTVASQNIKTDFVLGDSAYGTIEGTITHETTGQPLAGVKVTLGPVNRVYTTEDNGGFLFSDLPGATYKITAELQGYSIQPNNFGLAISTGQIQRLRLTASPIVTATPTPTITPPQGTDTEPPAGTGGCGSAGLGVLILLTTAFGTLRERRR